MTDHPIERFNTWYRDAVADGVQNHPSAMCLSTVSPDGWPEARFVALKKADDEGFVFCTHAASDKVAALGALDRAALTFWWDVLERQVRIQGTVERLPRSEAEAFFRQRNRQAQITTWASEQSRPLDDPARLAERMAAFEDRFAGGDVPCPEHWAGFRLRPRRIEFLVFQADRRHHREVFVRQGGGWTSSRLQP